MIDYQHPRRRPTAPTAPAGPVVLRQGESVVITRDGRVRAVEHEPAAFDRVMINSRPLRIEYIGTGEYSIYVVTPEGGRFALDRGELSLIAPAAGYGVPAVWECWTDANGRRA